MDIRAYAPSDEADVVALWQRCGLTRPWNNPEKDIRRKLAVRPDLFLVGTLNGKIVASVMAGYDGHRGWINYLAVCPDHRKLGLGRRIMNRAESLLREVGCPKINLQIRSDNTEAMAFYKRLGFSMDEVVSLGKRLEADQA
jgi:ribosomal protein S18 acetylase RimI-like enzyme